MYYKISYMLQGRPIEEHIDGSVDGSPDFYAYIRACEKCMVPKVVFECSLNKEDLK